ncbi:hypothetical protein A2W24_03585 [Microgenomates group bacterium RBG_16_45_19]|nr:MAG: hypothetical protein A2W24_03585 [Microgenomates group bacterium RBG_16_45_19]
MKNKNVKIIPKFNSEDDERKFWATHDATDYFDMNREAKMDLSKLKPTTEAISLRLPAFLLARIKQLANKKDVPYQSLMKVYLNERVERELRA